MAVLNGKRAVVTGAARGIGEAIARRFADEGASLILIDQDGDVLRETTEKFRSSGARATCLTADLGDVQTLPKLAEDILACFGGVDIVVSNAGISGAYAPLKDISFEAWRHVQAVNLEGPLVLLQLLAPSLFNAENAAVVIISSSRSQFGAPVGAPYVASKAALNSVTKSLACEWGASGVRVNAILPGPIETAIIQQALGNDPVPREALAKMFPLKRWASPEDIAGPALFLASQDAKHVTGHLLVVDGGFTIQSPEHYMP